MEGSRAYAGASYDRYAQSAEHSTSHKLKNAYWTTKQVVMRKLGRKEDEHVVASDSELDAKLELFKSVQITCQELLRIICRYQVKIYALSQAENELGRFLKTNGEADKTQAGKMMAAVGKSLNFSAQQRLSLRTPLARLGQEVETFHRRAVADTSLTLDRMESSRTEYRAALLWMKNASTELDPDTFKQLEKFRKVQSQVRKTKAKFDRVKLDSMQKIDLLSASRCNMFSHILASYQTTLLQFWEKTAKTMVAVAESFQGYQYYEFNMLKDLTGESKKLAELGRSDENDSEQGESIDDKLEDIFNQDYNEDEELPPSTLRSEKDRDSRRQMDSNDLLSGFDDDESNEDAAFLADLLGAPQSSQDCDIFASSNDFVATDEDGGFSQNWQSIFGDMSAPRHPGGAVSANKNAGSGPNANYDGAMHLLMGGDFNIDPNNWSCDDTPSPRPPPHQDTGDRLSMLSLTSQLSTTSQNYPTRSPGKAQPASASLLDGPQGTASELEGLFSSIPPSTQQQAHQFDMFGTGPSPQTDLSKKQENWFSMFADLDPLANPDALSKNEGQISDI